LKTLFIIAPLSFDSCHLAPADVWTLQVYFELN
jgi:hypothetical protein